jgi:hypothetical protein
MSQLKKSTGYSRNIRRSAAASPTTKKRRATNSPPPSTGVKWEWGNDSNGFTAYDSATCDIIETAYVADPTQTFDMTHSFFGKQGGYSIDLQAMTQTKKSSNYVRAIRRTDSSGVTTGGMALLCYLIIRQCVRFLRLMTGTKPATKKSKVPANPSPVAPVIAPIVTPATPSPTPTVRGVPYQSSCKLIAYSY